MNLKTVAQFESHVQAEAQASAPKGRKIVQWFRDQLTSFLSNAGAGLDKNSLEATIKKLWDTIVVPTDGIPDFLDALLWSAVILPVIDRWFANHHKPAPNPPAPETTA